MYEILETAPRQAAQPASVFMAIFATGLRGGRESEACTQGEPPGMPSNAFKESVLLFLLPLPFPLLECQTKYFNRSKHVKINALSSFKSRTKPTFEGVSLLLLEMGGAPSHTALTLHLASASTGGLQMFMIRHHCQTFDNNALCIYIHELT